MNDIFAQIQESLTDQAIGTLAEKTGLSADKGGDIANGVIGLLFDKLANNASKDEKEAEAIQKTIEKHDDSVLDDISQAIQDGKISAEDGTKILKHLFKNQDTEKVADQLAQQTGQDKGGILNMMKYLAPLALSALNKTKKQTGNLDIPQMIETLTKGGASANNLSSIAKNVVTNLLDQDGDGDLDIQDAVTAIAGNNKKKSGGLLSGLLGGIFGKRA